MKIEIKIDEGCAEPKIIVVTNKVTDEINEIVKRLSGEQSQVTAGFRDEQVIVLEPNQIVRIYASNGKVYVEAENGTYLLRLRLYEMELRRLISSRWRSQSSMRRSTSLCFGSPQIKNTVKSRSEEVHYEKTDDVYDHITSTHFACDLARERSYQGAHDPYLCGSGGIRRRRHIGARDGRRGEPARRKARSQRAAAQGSVP